MSVSSGTIKLGIAAIVVGLVGAYLAQVILSEEEEVASDPPAPQTVPLATIDLPAGREIRLGDVGLMKFTTTQMKERGWNLSRVMLSPEQVIGRTLKEPLKVGQPFETTALYPEGEGPNPLSRLKPGYRAVDLQVAMNRGGDAQVGDTVDVVFRTTPREATATQSAVPEITVTLASAMEVIDVPGRRPAGQESTVTLAATPEQARKFAVVRDKGDISLLARSPDESALAFSGNQDSLSFNELLGIKPPEPKVINRFDTVIYRRGQANMNSFLLDENQVARLQEKASAANSPAYNNETPVPPSLPPVADEQSRLPALPTEESEETTP